MSAPRPPFVEIECCQLTKDGQAACGDVFLCERVPSENRCVAVLSDGLGSGVKANLLAGLTATMSLEFAKSNLDTLQSAETIMDSLPVCDVRKISYATFTIVDLNASGRARLVEMGNPEAILLRDNREIPPFAVRSLVSERWPDREMRLTDWQLQLGDRLIFCSDGVTQSGLGTAALPLGFEREGCLKLVQKIVADDPGVSAAELSRAIAFYATSLNPERRVVDDTSCAVLYLRKPRVLRILTGPPYHKSDDARFAALVHSDADTTVVCGGTTANILARELKTTVEIDPKLRGDDGLPPAGHMAGVGLVTEGILTMTRVAELLEQHDSDRATGGCRLLIHAMEDSDVIEFIVGTKVNEANFDPSLPLDLEFRRNVVKQLARILTEQYHKEVTVQFL